MSEYSEFFLNSFSNVVYLETLEISHPNFSQVYYVVRNAVNGISAKIEDETTKDFIYYPLRITPSGNSNDLDQTIKVEFGDLGEVIPLEIDLVSNANGFSIKPTVKYRAYRSDNLNRVLNGPITLEIKSIFFNKTGCSFEAKAPSLNINKTGELYKMDRFPMLRGLL